MNMDSGDFEGFVRVSDDEQGENEMELPAEADGTMLLTTIQAQYPGALGLKYRSPSGNSWRGVRLANDVLFPPSGGWADNLFIVTMAKNDSVKRKMEESPTREPDAKKTATAMVYDTASDLIVLGLSYKANEEDMKNYFEQFGEVEMAELKKEPQTGKSRGFGFIRFKDPGVASNVITQTHIIMGRRAEVKLPKSKETFPSKIFVGRLPESVAEGELRAHFTQYGDISDVYVPKPHRGFGFVTFQSYDVAQRVMQINHNLEGHRLNISYAEPKGGKEQQRSHQDEYTSFGGSGRGGGHFRGGHNNHKGHHSASSREQEKPFNFEEMSRIFSPAGLRNLANMMAAGGASPAGQTEYGGMSPSIGGLSSEYSSPRHYGYHGHK